mgnify:CR=1 FL=1
MEKTFIEGLNFRHVCKIFCKFTLEVQRLESQDSKVS